ncbi:DUF4179 domain-containing protein [Paenibacillus elgii]|uniref:DUF4179 domain-containing protein n=1 Tax=Paenibacillus elgii TaxID=189691 RepID=UPI00167BDD78|nr:DUF4179 domain-containing protein [Paenibacillus elgii]
MRKRTANLHKRELPEPMSQWFQERIGCEHTSVAFDQIWSRYSDNMTREAKRHRFKGRGGVRKKVALAVSAACLLILSILGAGYVSPTFAAILEKISFIDVLYKNNGELKSPSWREIEQKQLSTKASLEATDHGIRMRITDVFYDGVKTLLVYDLEGTPSKLSLQGGNVPMSLDFNFIGHSPSYVGGGDNVLTQSGHVKGTIEIRHSLLPDHVQLQVNISSIGVQEGAWQFTIPLSTDTLSADIRTFKPNVAAQYGEHSIVVKQVRFTPVSTVLTVETTASAGKWGDVDFGVSDDWGTYLHSEGGIDGIRTENDTNGSAQEIVTRHVVLDTIQIRSHPEYLVLRPYTPQQSPAEYELKQTYDGTMPMVFHQGNSGKVTITDVQFEPDKTLVYYETDRLDHQDAFMYVEDSRGKPIYNRTWPVRVAKEPIAFVREFPPMDRKDKLEFNVKVWDEWKSAVTPFEIKIPLKWE